MQRASLPFEELQRLGMHVPLVVQIFQVAKFLFAFLRLEKNGG